MKEYEDRKYKVWREHVEVILPGLLKRNLLTRPQDQMPSGKTHEHAGGDDGDDTHRSMGEVKVQILTSKEKFLPFWPECCTQTDNA